MCVHARRRPEEGFCCTICEGTLSLVLLCAGGRAIATNSPRSLECLSFGGLLCIACRSCGFQDKKTYDDRITKLPEKVQPKWQPVHDHKQQWFASMTARRSNSLLPISSEYAWAGANVGTGGLPWAVRGCGL